MSASLPIRPPSPLKATEDPHNAAAEEQLPEMGLMDHLAELRRRLILSITAIGLMAVVGYVYAQPIFEVLNRPYFDAFKGNSLIGTGPAEAFLLKMKVALFAGIVLAAPFVFYQVWLFIAPGLYSHEKKRALPFLLCSTSLFVIGIWFGYEVIFPYAFEFFHAEYTSVGLTPTVRMSEHLSTIITGLLGFGAVFQMPVLAYFLARLGIITDSLLINNVRYAIVAIFIVAAVLTPPDVITQLLFAGPLLVLYGISIMVVRLVQKDSHSDDVSL